MNIENNEALNDEPEWKNPEDWQSPVGIRNEIELRGITQVVHFTTMRGAIGILASRAVKSRARLEEDKFLEHVYMPNANFRKDIQ